MKLPLREKYIDEIVGIWFEFGVYLSGNVDISDSDDDLFTDVPKEIGARLIEAQARFRAELYSILGQK